MLFIIKKYLREKKKIIALWLKKRLVFERLVIIGFIKLGPGVITILCGGRLELYCDDIHFKEMQKDVCLDHHRYVFRRKTYFKVRNII